MSKQANTQTQKKMGDAINSGQLETFREIFSADVVDHDPAPGQAAGPAGFIQFFTGFRSAFPDLAITVEHAVADEDNIALAYTATGTHQGEFMGFAPTGRKIEIRGLQIARFESGKIVERWGSSDELGILKQIGAVPAPGPEMAVV